jgi:hypothetical protein
MHDKTTLMIFAVILAAMAYLGGIVKGRGDFLAEKNKMSAERPAFCGEKTLPAFARAIVNPSFVAETGIPSPTAKRIKDLHQALMKKIVKDENQMDKLCADYHKLLGADPLDRKALEDTAERINFARKQLTSDFTAFELDLDEMLNKDQREKLNNLVAR